MAESRDDPSSIGQASQRSVHKENGSRYNEIQEDLSLALNTFDDHIQAGLAELRSLVSKLRGERTGLSQHIANLGAELHQMTVERDHLQHTLSQQQKEISDIKDMLNKQGDENGNLRREISDIKDKFNKQGDENGNLRREIKEMEDLYNNHLQKIAGRHRNRTLAQKSVSKWRRKMHSFPHSKKVQFSMLESENENLRAELLACQEAAKQAFLHSANTLNTQALSMFQDAATRRLGLDMKDESEQGQQSSQLSSPTSSSVSSNSSHQSTQSSQGERRSNNSTPTGDKENITTNESESRIADERRIGRSGSDNIRESRDNVRSEKYHRRTDDHTVRDESRSDSDEFRRNDRTRRSARENLVRPEDHFQSSEQVNLSNRNQNMMGQGRGNYYINDAGTSEQGKGTFTFEMRGPRLDNLDHISRNDYRLRTDTNWNGSLLKDNIPKAASNSITSLHAEPLRQETLAHLRQLREEQQRRPAQNITSVYEPQRKNPRTLTSRQQVSSSKCSCSQATAVCGSYRCPYCNPIHNIRDDLPVNKTKQTGTRYRNTVPSERDKTLPSERDKRKVIYKPSASTVVIEKHINK